MSKESKTKAAMELDAEMIVNMFEHEGINFDPLSDNYEVLKEEILRRLKYYDKVMEFLKEVQ